LSTTAANAATVYTTAISVTTDKAPVAGVNGTAVTHTLRFSTATTASVTVEPNVILTSKPTGSVLAYQAEGATTAPASGKFEIDNNADELADATDANGVDLTTGDESGYTYDQGKVYLHVRYDVAGTYTWTVFDDQGTDDGVYNGTDFGTTFTVVVGATGVSSTYVATVAAQNSSSVVDGTNGSLVKIGLTSAGVAASPDNAGGVKVTLTGSAKVDRVNDGNVDNSSTYILGNGDFNGSGFAWINVTNTAAETVTLTLSGTGSMTSSLTAPSAITLSYVAEVASTSVPVIGRGAALATAGILVSSDATAGADGAATANKAATAALVFQTGKSAATVAKKDKVVITDTSGVVTGLANADYDILVTESDSDDALTYNGAFSVTPTWNSGVTGQSFKVANKDGFGLVVTSATAAATTATVSSADVIRSVYGATHSFTVNVDNQFGANMSNVAVSAAIAGRNSTVNVASAISNASGNAVLTYTDASTSTTSLVDTLTFTAASGVTDTASVTYTSLAGLGVSTVLATTSQTSATTGADLTTITPFAIAAGSDGVEAGVQTVTITVKDANGVGLAGVPVTVSVAGSGAAILSTTQTVYTGATGTTTASVYAWLAPTYGTNYVVTATAGGVSDTVNTYWAQSTAAHTRNFTATASGRVITVVAKDRLGNPVLGAEFTARITAGDGFFGTGTNIATGSTDTTGTLKFVTLESPTPLTVVVQAGNPGSATYAQTDAPAGNISSAVATDVFTAATAGTATTAETGVGATFAPAGNNTATVTVEPVQTAAEVAADAAAEATDAANAATDAANAAAEAADAATAAAQDAADAVAALATSVEAMVSALKKQITSLTNLVIKIQKKVKA
jgi:hypothetical protein